MNEELDELLILYEKFFDEISEHSQEGIRQKLKELLKYFKKNIIQETNQRRRNG